MASFSPFSPTTAITRAMFNFDAMDGSNYVLTGPIRVTVADDFLPADVSGTEIYPELATTGTAEVDWTPIMTGGVAETLDIIRQFAAIDLQYVGDTDSIGGNATPNPADVAAADLADITISLINRANVDWVGFSGGNDDSIFGYTGAAGDVFVNRAFLAENDFTIGTPSRTTLMHELLHSLGLSHPHSDYVDDKPVITADYAQTRLLGFDQLGFRTATAADLYKEYFTIMSYDDGNVFQESHTPQILDVIALQAAYGEGDGTTGTGDDTIVSGNAGYRVYFDKGGVDTIDLAAWDTGVSLNMGVTIVSAPHLVGVAMSMADATQLATTDPGNLRWFYGEYENASGSAAADRMTGNVLGNRILGLAGDDRLLGAGGNDVLGGGLGNDVLGGGAGNDVLQGGAGNDSADYAGAKSGVTVNLGKTAAQPTGGAGSDTLASIENLLGSVHGDRLTGSAGGNLLKGGGGDDVLTGLGGSDTLVGGAGNDVLTGGAGRDFFLFDRSSAGGVDRIADFLFRDDTIELDNALFTRLGAAGGLAAGNFRENPSGTAADANDFVVYNTRTGVLSYDPDGNGGRHGFHIATLWDGASTHPGAAEISHLDFLVV